MTNEERIIRNLRKRRTRIVAYTLIVVVFSVGLMGILKMAQPYADGTSAERLRSLFPFRHPEEEIPEVLSYACRVTELKAKMMLSAFYFSAFVGVFLGLLIVELLGRNRDLVLVAMWDRIKKLEAEVGTDTGGQQEDRQLSSEPAPSASSDEVSS